MPGIHLRTFSDFNWVNQGRESILTIPGSYWLCHKKNIYKFIFKYHHTVKNIMQFSYGRELMKIIRRIIKCHPGQGQQFGTQHLLVTYNYTSWTRQDKIFALLKFQQRTNAATFSHAFVLTIRIYPSKESLCKRRYPIKEIDADVTFQDLNVSLDTKEKITKSVTCTINKLSSKMSPTISATKKLDKISNYNVVDNTSHEILKATVNPNFQDNIVTTSIHFHESPDEKMKNATITSEVHLVDKRNTEFHNMCKAKFVNSNTKKNTKYSIDFMQGKSLEAYNKINEIEIKSVKNVDKEIKSTVMKKQDQEPLNIRKYKMFSSKLPITEIIEHDVDEWSLSNKFNFIKDSIKKSDAYVNSNENDLDDKKIIRERYIGSIDMPYQYFIKKKIENTKHDILINQSVQINSEITKKNINENIIPKIIKPITNTSMQKDHSETFDLKLKSKENDEQHLNVQILSNDDNQFQNNTYNKYKIRKQKNKEPEKNITEDKILRSSNITDLVMEGLMFTIKQDKDSVAVIEQKTKLEMDEVLENSEKVETKAGEKCLLNSSLMRLENLVTMIDSPREQQNKTDHASDNSAHVLPLHIFPSCVVHNLSDTNYTNRRLDKPNVFSSNIRNDRINDLTDLIPYQSQWQYVSSDISDNTNLLTIEDLMKKNKYLMEWQDSNEQNKKDNQMEIKEYEKEEEKDISENLASTIFSKKAINDMNNVKQIGKYESLVEKYSDPIEMHTTAALNERKLRNVSTKSKLNIPRIISDKLITVEQIPLALQKVLQHKYETRRFSSATVSSETLKHDGKIQHSMTDNMIPKTTILSLEDKGMNLNIANKSIKVAIDLEETKRDKNKCNIIDNESNLKMNKNTLEINDQRYIYARNAKRNSSEIQRFSRRNSTLKHGSSRKLQDITEDFYYDLHAHNKDSTIQQRCLRQRHRSLDNTDNIKNDKVRIEMLKFIQDITEGARVVVKRLDMNNKSNLLKKISL